MIYKPPIKAIIDRPKDFVPKGYCCCEYGINGKECPFLQWRKMTPSRLEQFKKIFVTKDGQEIVRYDIPSGNKYLQYCSYLKEYLSVQDCIKDCDINMGWCTEEELDEIMCEATSDGIDEELRRKNDELIEKDVEDVIEKIRIKEKYELLAKYAEKHKEE
jgi:hypothetical protein